MKYANCSFSGREVNNLGDQIQIIALDQIYKEMGIKEKDIITIDFRALREYKGEYVILPIVMPMVDYYPNGFADRLSENIIPVFVALTMIKQTLSEEEVAYLKKWEPIGCRDEYTLNTMRRYGIQAYLNGCITVTFPRRIKNNQNKVFIVDIGTELLDFIPKNIREHAEYRTHLRRDVSENPKKAAYNQYQEYINDAGLVITGLLHCAVPCLAAGIPTIILRNSLTFRMSWLDKIVPIYTADKVKDIDWNPKAIEIREHQDRVRQLVMTRIRDAFERYSKIYDVSYFYENRDKGEYVNDACEPFVKYIMQNWNKERPYKYAVWGLNQSAEWLVDYISNSFPKATLSHVYDSFRTEKLKGIVSEEPENIKDYLDETVFVTAVGAEKPAMELLKKISFPLENCVFFN